MLNTYAVPAIQKRLVAGTLMTEFSVTAYKFLAFCQAQPQPQPSWAELHYSQIPGKSIILMQT